MCSRLQAYLVREAMEDLEAPLVVFAAGRLVESKVRVKPRPDKPLHSKLAYPVKKQSQQFIMLTLFT